MKQYKILWIVNMIFPEAEKQLSGNGILKNTGGWLLASANELVKRNEFSLAVVGVSPRVDDLTIIQGEKILYYVIPLGKGNNSYNSSYEKYWKRIIEDFNPDLVNINGTEFPHSLSYLRSCPGIKTVLTIQGLSNQIAIFHNYGMSKWEILKNITPRDIARQTLLGAKRAFVSKGECEKEILRSVKYVIGRTTWDKSMALDVNPELMYYHCNESLRESFSNGCWSYSTCQPHTIFLSQASSPFKGLHQLIKALVRVVSIYPDTKVRIAGQDILRSGGRKEKLKMSGYGKFIQKLINKYNLNGCIEFVGFLDEQQIKAELLNSNVYIIPSSIENSPNSLCEAQMLGVPSIGSYVGGIADFIPSKAHGEMFRFEDYEVLSTKIISIFENSSSFDNTEMRRTAHARHDVKKNVDVLVNIYKDILSK